MSAAIAAIAKRLAVMLATDKRTWKLIGAIAGGLLFIALLPVMVLLSIGHQLEETDIGTNFGAAFIQNLTPEQQSQFSQMESDGKAIADELTSLNLKSEIVKAQVIFFTYFEDIQREESFFQEYCLCFQEAQRLLPSRNRSRPRRLRKNCLRKKHRILIWEWRCDYEKISIGQH